MGIARYGGHSARGGICVVHAESAAGPEAPALPALPRQGDGSGDHGAMAFSGFSRSERLFADAEAAEDFAEDVFGVGVADDAAEEVQRGAEFDGGEFGGLVGLNQCRG